jgi:hypothetical protein
MRRYPVGFSARCLVCAATVLVGTPRVASAQDLGAVLVWEADLRLSETPEALVVEPNLRRMPGGGWLSWETRGHQVRIYEESGTLKTVFGREGQGPGEFSSLRGVDVLPDGRVVAIDGRGQLSVWNALRGALEFEFQSRVEAPFGLAIASASVVVVSARGAPNTELLHLVDLRSRARTESFFSPTIPPNAFTPYVTVAHPPIVVAAGRIYRAVPPYDSIWSVGIASPHTATAFRVAASRLTRNGPPVSIQSGGPAAARAWITSSSHVGTFGRTSDGGWIVQVWGGPLREGKPTRSLVRLRSDGQRVWEVDNAPSLLAVEEDRLYLWDPEGLEPNRIRVARLR